MKEYRLQGKETEDKRRDKGTEEKQLRVYRGGRDWKGGKWEGRKEVIGKMGNVFVGHWHQGRRGEKREGRDGGKGDKERKSLRRSWEVERREMGGNEGEGEGGVGEVTRMSE